MKREAMRHPKTYALASMLGITRAHAIGLLECLLDYTADVAAEGNIGKWPNGTIAGACDWAGSPDEFVAALVKAGWLDECPRHRLVIHDLKDHAELWWKTKLQRLGKEFVSAEKMPERSREASGEYSKESSILLVSSLPQPLPVSSQLDPSVSCPETAEPSSVPTVTTTSEPSILDFPCDGMPNVWSLTGSQAASWRSLFPSLDIEAECRNALAWVLADSNRRKTARGMQKFLVGWFGRSQNRGGKSQSHSADPRGNIATMQRRLAALAESEGEGG